MVANFGYGVLALSFLVSLYGIFAALYGGLRNRAAWVESARLATLLSFPADHFIGTGDGIPARHQQLSGGICV